MTTLIPLTDINAQAIEDLLDIGFGKDRRSRTAYRLREGVSAIPELSFAAVQGTTLQGIIQCWPVRLSCLNGQKLPMILLGPVAVHPSYQGQKLGQKLVQHSLDIADSSEIRGSDAIMLIGDPEYYDRFFGFSADETKGWRLPGPVEQRRLLARLTSPRLQNRAGIVEPDVLILSSKKA
ncbi:MAG: N-acetyltransferase [Zymomonas mobilis subsp. pomaceae]|uniref:GCN5-related N-acetyltransferase n=1 Tax=Zymomonas mobilis subsp. pomaceae (strain ATCC 29192 / DSM 22645 / JCM 10191 / CCUG 17912 / NBRC 13757 / NCIMB 11200 / NRRL B-4491 / Barker I) TaxID=579138 RepID=F8EU52_ZYMMT|nr:N-acetyltransferase [Zymomonas mobilis]AEI37132.1 GCN5-related N-acetyltransferase [Zymomonas mobilis subsp. pomaceae ATCC 29192]MDX5948503.1 N-acetyltransferase [Zymomonas mobilis subsp. pomaceae]GEB89432.1 N-acetyltransferase GCN5 [Zymomonas mobilis subsp. pomaceae]